METEKVAIVSFEGMIKRKAIEIKRRLVALESESGMILTVKAEGPIHNGELKFSYKLEGSYDIGVTGNSLDAVIDEWMRQRGWKKANKPLMLSQGEQDQYEV